MSNWSSLHVCTIWTTKSGSRSNEGRGYFDDDDCLVFGGGSSWCPPVFSVDVVLTSVRSLGLLLQQLQCKKDALWLAGRVTCAVGLHYSLPLSVVSTEAPTGPSELHSNKSVYLYAIQRHRVSNVSYNYVNQTNLLDWLIEMSIIKQNAVRDHLGHVTNQNSTWSNRSLATA